jgi:pilus assembly protein CpaB
MRPKSLALLLLALGCGLVAAIGVSQVMATRNAGTEASSGDTKAIFVAITDIGMGDLLASQVLRLEQWPKDKVPPGAVARIEDIEGRRTRTRLYAGEPILENKLLGKGTSQQGATAMIPKGYRVVPVKVDLVSGGSSLIVPGDRVDVMVHLESNASRGIPETVTLTVLQDIKVFAVNDVVEMDKEKDGATRSITAKTISLLVTPEQAAKVMLAVQMGIVNLVMRSPEDDLPSKNVRATTNQLISSSDTSHRKDEEPPALPEPKPVEKIPVVVVPRNTWTMRILKPGAMDEVSFEAEEMKTPSASPFGQWKATTTTNTPAAAQAVKEDVKTIGPPAAQEPSAPSQPKSGATQKPSGDKV